MSQESTERSKRSIQRTGYRKYQARGGLNSCKYLRACLDESMRLSPPVPGILPRTVLPGGFKIDGHFLAEGTEVGVCTYAIHHNKKYFSEPFEYRPERWLDDDEQLEDAQKAFSPFSLGPRGCIGKNMAYMEMMITMARVLIMFEIRLVGTLGEGESSGEVGRRRKGEFQVKDCFISLKDGPMIEFQGVY
jgi:cytochrome P450